MTKFEEEFKRPDNGPITELNNSMQEVLSQYRKMREYADYLEYELKQKNEHILKVENENSFMRDERTTFDSNGNSIEPIITQQALPVVPECVGEWIECVKGKNKNALALLDDDNMPDDVNEWLFFQRNDDNINLILRAWLDGYTVEKPQLFYLKHIDFCKTDKHYDWFTIKHSDGPLNHLRVEKGQKPSTIDCKFTQQEIDSMQTGSYEQIEVTE
ncbi:DUF1642 domain-containing protein [Lactococcus lactis]|uniref:DUF1642 domain-containing protein n=1 Tax=Lactococcus lactis TaxID=1358 RepID=UPI0021A4082F|nr:DUF1642 domain-containing protein [Lactococcus lactis]MCT3093384.1 DUF1642 domain-containing protein [Lactococcus lactis]